MFPRDRLDNGYCVAGPDGPVLYRLHAERAVYYKADIALLAGLHPLRVVVTPATPQPTDVCLRGWECRAVISATDREEHVTWDGDTHVPTIGLLDCRPLLGGWLSLSTRQTWLDLEPVRWTLNQSAPQGWHAIFPGLPAHWTWVCLQPGQVIVAAFAPDDADEPMPEARWYFQSRTDQDPADDPPRSDTPEDGQATQNPSPRPRGSATPVESPPADNGTVDSPHRRLFPVFGLFAAWCAATALVGLVLPSAHLADAPLRTAVACALLFPTGSASHLSCSASLGVVLGGDIVTAMQIPSLSVDGTCQHTSQAVSAAVGNEILRPVPTPCRWRNHGHELPGVATEGWASSTPATEREDSPSHEAHLITLLEEAVIDDDTWAFLAATLLETLVEHFIDPPDEVACCHPLSLSKYLPSVPVHDLTAATVDFGSFFATAGRLVFPGSWLLERTLPRHVLCDAAAWHLYEGCPRELPCITAMQIFTDGSYNGQWASWAFAAIDTTADVPHLHGWAAGRVAVHDSEPGFVGAHSHTPLSGEQTALLWAIIWALQLPPGIELTFFSDCQVALRQATGRYGAQVSSRLPACLRHLFQALVSARPGFGADITHVRSHQGTTANELVDRLAKSVNQDGLSGGPSPSHLLLAQQWCLSPQLPWLWLAFEAMRCPQNRPLFTGTYLSDRHPHDLTFQPTRVRCRDFFGLPAATSASTTPADLCGALCVFNLNTQTLEGDVPASQPQIAEDAHFLGKAAFLREQFEYYGAHVVALQEARAPADGMFVSATHIRLCTGRDKQGNFGVELWLSRLRPFAWIGQTAVHFNPAHLLVLCSSPRELFVRYCRGSLRILFVSVHGPVATCPSRESWWQAFRQKVERFCHGSQVVILGDLNIHFDDPIAGHVGDKVFPTKHALPEGFQNLLVRHGLWIPSTFTQCHPHEHVTWVPPSGGPGARLDYAVLPRSWQVRDGESQVFHALDWGQAHVDHFALRTFVQFRGLGVMSTCATRPAYDREAMLTEDGRSTLKHIFASTPQPDWSSNVHEHSAVIQKHVVNALSVAFPPVKRHCRASHFSADTWQLRQRRVWLRRQITRLRHLGRSFGPRCALSCLRYGGRFLVRATAHLLRNGRALLVLAAHVTELRDTKRTLRQAIRRDVSSRIHDAANTAATSGTGSVVSRLHSILAPAARKTKPPRRLPGLTLADGTPATEPADVEAAWVAHFSGIENGTQRPPEELVASCLEFQRKRPLDMVDFLPQELPTRSELEAAFRDTMLHRAYGVDGIPAEALHAVPGAAAAAFFPVVLKASLRLAEPVQFKGGSLFAIWKGKASPGICSSYRGILVSSNVGKAFHKIVRARNIPALQQAAAPLQIGGLPRCPVTLAAQTVRLHQSWAKQHGFSQAVLFLDLREAFYRIVRPLVTGFSGTDEEVAQILSAVHLPPGVMHELREHLQTTSLLAASGSPSWTSEMTCEALQHTWFRFQQGTTVTQTGIGTRPGDNLADIIFSFVFARVLHQIRQCIADHQALTELPWHPDMLDNLWEVTDPSRETLTVLDSTWMDDAAFVLRHANAHSLIGNLKFAAGALLDSCLGRALLPNLDRGKTEAVVSLQGSGSRALRAQLFREDLPTIPADSRLWPDAHVRLVAQYRHLGGVIHHTGELQREVKLRTALAWQAFNKRRKQVFGSPTVARTDKVLLFDSLVLSVLLYGAGSWCSVEDKALSLLATTYHHMVASMLRPQYKVEEARHLGPARVLALAGLPSMPVLIHLARLQHLSSCVTVGIKEFWALAHAEGTWLRLARDSLCWLRELVVPKTDCQDWDSLWPHWVTMIRYRPGTWKRLLRTAQARAVRRETWQSSQQNHQGLLSRQLQIQGGLLICPPPPQWDRRYCCAPCGKVFATKQRWSVHAFKTHGRVATGRGLLESLRVGNVNLACDISAPTSSSANTSPTVRFVDTNLAQLGIAVPPCQARDIARLKTPTAPRRLYSKLRDPPSHRTSSLGLTNLNAPSPRSWTVCPMFWMILGNCLRRSFGVGCTSRSLVFVPKPHDCD